METLHSEQLSETILCRLTKDRIPPAVSDLTALRQHLVHDLNIDDATFASAVAELQSKRILHVQQDGSPFLAITDEKSTGVQRLMRKFCKRYYGEVSPLIDRKTIQAVLKRHGADFDIDAPEVRSELLALEEEGLIRIVDRDDAFLKLLGAE
jgi:hypothetical protein